MSGPHTVKLRPAQGGPCKRGHVSGRSAKNYCKECDRLASKVRRAAHPERYKNRKRASVVRSMLQGAYRRAREGGFACTLTAADITIPEFCPLLGLKLERAIGQASPASPSLDKIRPGLGYVPGNVWVISHRANELKRDAGLKELQTLVDNLAKTYIVFPWDKS